MEQLFSTTISPKFDTLPRPIAGSKTQAQQHMRLPIHCQVARVHCSPNLPVFAQKLS